MWTMTDRQDVDWLWGRLWSGDTEVLQRMREFLPCVRTLADRVHLPDGPAGQQVHEAFESLDGTWAELLSGAERLSGLVGEDVAPAGDREAGQVLAALIALASSAEYEASRFLESLGALVTALGEALKGGAHEADALDAAAAAAGFGDEAEQIALLVLCYDWLGPESMSVIRETLAALRTRTDKDAPPRGPGFQAYARPAAAGFAPADPDGLRLHADYEGEEDGQHWRAREADRTALSTLYLDLKDREAYRATICDGDVILADGSVLAPRSTRGWVLAEDEQLYVFDDGCAHLYDASGTFVETRTIESVSDIRPHIEAGGRVKLTHHSSVVGGTPVVAAGMITVDAAGTLSLDNWSGHYRPQAADMGVAAGRLIEKHGLSPDARMVLRGDNGPTGRAVPGLEGIYAVHDQIRNTPDGYDNPYTKGDTSVPAAVLADLGEHADLTSIKFHDRVVAQLKREAPRAVTPDGRDSPTTTGTTGTTTRTATATDESAGSDTGGTVYEED
ncbi:hypothetical protein ACFXPI_02280 [Streptomyces sp. NPDC059104]|uniref:hypothetical protein n=1 Tax=Streptomyces sp. NPDC059104 TaxID=3346729 RepID=UPI0036BF3161